MVGFAELVGWRKEWLEKILKPWCAQAALKDLQAAEAEWLDIAGRADPTATLWTWAWSRFPALIHEGFTGINETNEVQLTLKDGTNITGFPDGRRSQRGCLVLVTSTSASPGPGRYEESRPITIDEIATVRSAR